tara:strand:- start:138 stop:1109 length:972 start_codon:yes stop_codon:yes gene_type:complete
MITKGIIIIPTQGFANRLRMIASSYILCKFIETPLHVCWISSIECNVEYHDIFHDDDFNIINLNEFQESNYLYFGRHHTQNIINNIIDIHHSKEKTCDYFILEGGHEFKPPTLSVQSFVYQKHMFYNSLKFSSIIRDKVTSFSALYDLNRTIGIHYRDIINKYDNNDILNNDLINFTKNSPIEKFENIIINLKNISNYDNLLVVSNNPEIYHKFKNNIKSKSFIKTNTELYDRNNKNAIIDSVTDFLILSKTCMIIGTFYSSFSDEASFVNFIPKITPISDSIGNTQLVYHCLNYTNKNNLPCLNQNDKIFFHLFGEGICNLN